SRHHHQAQRRDYLSAVCRTAADRGWSGRTMTSAFPSQRLKIRFLPAVPGSNAAGAAAAAANSAAQAQAAANAATQATATKVDKGGDTMTGALTLNGNPTSALHAATKQYVDSQAVSDGSITNAKLANMPAWTVKVRNAATTGVPSDAGLADVTTKATPTTGDFLFGFASTGELRKFDVGTLPTGSGSVADGSITNAKLADMPAWSIKVRNAGTTGVPSDGALATVTSKAPVAGDFLVGFAATGELRKFDVGGLPSGTGTGNVSNSGLPATDQVGIWVTSTTIKGVGGTANQVLRCTGTTPSFGSIDLSQAATVGTSDLAF